jgi:hypothetical protein
MGLLRRSPNRRGAWKIVREHPQNHALDERSTSGSSTITTHRSSDEGSTADASEPPAIVDAVTQPRLFLPVPPPQLVVSPNSMLTRTNMFYHSSLSGHDPPRRLLHNDATEPTSMSGSFRSALLQFLERQPPLPVTLAASSTSSPLYGKVQHLPPPQQKLVVAPSSILTLANTFGHPSLPGHDSPRRHLHDASTEPSPMSQSFGSALQLSLAKLLPNSIPLAAPPVSSTADGTESSVEADAAANGSGDTATTTTSSWSAVDAGLLGNSTKTFLRHSLP